MRSGRPGLPRPLPVPGRRRPQGGPVLSGGERSRLELAVLGITPANLLLLDEPTNHLDIPAREALEAFLRETPATVLVVSHDRRLLETLCERLWVVDDGLGGRRSTAATGRGARRSRRAGRSRRSSSASGAPLRRRAPDGRRPPGPPAASARRPRPRAAARGAPRRRPAARPRTASAEALQGRLPAPEAASRPNSPGSGCARASWSWRSATRPSGANFVELRRLTSELADVEAALAAAEDAWLALEERAP